MPKQIEPVVPGACSKPLNIHEFEAYARTYLPKNAYDYYRSGANDMQTLKENEQAFSRLRIMPRMMRDMSNIDLSCSVLGHPVQSPIGVSPTAMHRMAHPEGELATARACAKAQNCMILSSLSSTSIEDVAEASGSQALRWFQLYIYRDREITQSLVKRAEKSGYRAIVLTVDTPKLGQREPDMRNRFQLPEHLSLANFTTEGGQHAYGVASKGAGHSGLAEYVTSLFDPTLSWADVKWLRRTTTLPIVLKGILSPEDAVIAADLGVEAILVSNHGARQLDGVPATIECLPDIIAAVGNRVEVYLDGGVRRGTDVYKALGLGAKAVFVGRPVLWGLSQGGEAGVKHVLEILDSELKLAMMFAGTKEIQAIGPEYIRHETYFRTAHL